MVSSNKVAATNKDRWQKIKRCWVLYLFLLLPLLYLIIFQYYPMYGAQIAFKNFRPRDGIEGSKWVGFKHFIKFFNDYQFTRILLNTITLSSYSIIASFVVTIIVALLLNAVYNEKFKKVVQMISYMPHFISTVVLVGILVQMLNPRIGVLAQIFQALGGTDRDLLGIPAAFPHLYVWSDIWQSVGWWTIVYIAALSGVDPSQHEAAIIDGANRLQRMIHIELPTIIPTAVIILIMNAGSIMNVGFEKVFLMQNNLTLSTSEVISTYVYKNSLGDGGRSDFSYSTAIGLFNSVINFVLVIFVNQISKCLKQSSLW